MAGRFAWTLASVPTLLAFGLATAEDRPPLEFPPPQAPPPPVQPAEETVSFWATPRAQSAPLDVAFRDLEIAGALRFLTGEQTNVVAQGGAALGTVTMDLRAVEPGEALDYLLASLNLGARIDGNTVFLSQQDTRTLRIPLVLQEESRVWEELATGIQNLLSGEGVIALNQSGGVLTIVESPDVLDRLEEHVDQVVQSLMQQLEIEVAIIEATYEVDRGGGIDWVLFNGILNPDWGLAGGAAGGSVGFQTPTNARDIFQVGLVNSNKWQFVVDAFQDDMDVNLVSRPRLTAMSNQPAEFALREKIPYLQKTVSQEGGVTRTDFEIVFDEAGVQLTVVASVTEGGEIQMEVHPIVSAVTGFTPILPDLGSQPIIDLRETKSILRLSEGQSMVLSGMMQDRESRTATGVPILMDIPWVGRLFRHEEISTDKTEIILILTPRFRMEPALRTLEEFDRLVTADVDAGEAGPTAELASARSRRAWGQLVGGQNASAIRLARAAHRTRPAAWWTLNNLALAQREFGLLGESEQTLQRATRAVDPPPAIALLNYGTLMLHRGRPGEAIEPLERAAALAPPGPVRREAHLAWALALELDGQTTPALDALDAAEAAGAAPGRIVPRRERLLATLAQASAP